MGVLGPFTVVGSGLESFLFCRLADPGFQQVDTGN
jgi:hypothetical protein